MPNKLVNDLTNSLLNNPAAEAAYAGLVGNSENSNTDQSVLERIEKNLTKLKMKKIKLQQKLEQKQNSPTVIENLRYELDNANLLIKLNQQKADEIFLQTNLSNEDEVELCPVVTDDTAIESNIEKVKELEHKIEKLSKPSFVKKKSSEKTNLEAELQQTIEDVRNGFDKSLILKKDKIKDLEEKIANSDRREFHQLKFKLDNARNAQDELLKRSLNFEEVLKSKDPERNLTLLKEQLSLRQDIKNDLVKDRKVIELNIELHDSESVDFKYYSEEIKKNANKKLEVEDKISIVEAKMLKCKKVVPSGLEVSEENLLYEVSEENPKPDPKSGKKFSLKDVFSAKHSFFDFSKKKDDKKTDQQTSSSQTLQN